MGMVKRGRFHRTLFRLHCIALALSMHSDEMESDDSDTYSEGDDDYVLDDSELNGWADAVDSPAPVRKTAVIVVGGDDDDDLMADDDDVCGTLFGELKEFD